MKKTLLIILMLGQKVFGDIYVNSRLQTRSTIDDLLSPDGHSVHTDIEKAELFNQFFHLFLLRKTSSMYWNL